jgi:hypothetical protein
MLREWNVEKRKVFWFEACCWRKREDANKAKKGFGLSRDVKGRREKKRKAFICFKRY